MIDGVPTRANDFIEQQLNQRLTAVGQAFDSECLSFEGDLIDGVDDLIRAEIEALWQRNGSQSMSESQPRLAVILTTDGGYIETVQRIVETIRHHYRHVAFIIPNHAFSAGTVLAMSGDEIWMDYYARLGPIDPQVPTSRGKRVPALGYLKQWERLLKKSATGKLTPAEAVLIIDGFDQAELYKYEQAAKLSVTLLKEWLVTYKFKDWTVRESSRQPVTPALKTRRAEGIARKLNNTDHWHSHGRGISAELIRQELNLKIDDLDASPEKCAQVKQYSELFSDYLGKLGIRGMLHTEGRFVPFSVA